MQSREDKRREEREKLKTRGDIRHHCHSSHDHGPPTTKHGKPRRPHTDTSTTETSSALHYTNTYKVYTNTTNTNSNLSLLHAHLHTFLPCTPVPGDILEAMQCTVLCKHTDAYHDCNHFSTHTHIHTNTNCASTV